MSIISAPLWLIALHVLSRHAFADRASGVGVGFVALPSVAAPPAPFPEFERRRMSRLIDCAVQQQQSINNFISVQRPLRSRCFASNSNRAQYRSRRRDPDMRNCKTIDEAVNLAYDHVDSMSPRGISAFWAAVSKLLQRQSRGSDRRQSRNGQIDRQIYQKFDKMMVCTLEDIDAFGYRDLAQTAISLAKIVNSIESRRGRLSKGSIKQILKDILIGNRSEKKQFIFDQIIARASIQVLPTFDPRCLSNFIYAYAIAGCSPKLEDGSSIFDIVAQEAIPNLKNFNSQDMSNMLWAYATAKESNSVLFEKAGDSIVEFDSLDEFEPQHLSNIVWAYATAKESHPDLFRKVAVEVVKRDLRSFNTQNLSNLVWAYATAKEQHPKLFMKVADHIAGLDNLNLFNPQGVSNLVWAYATAKEPSPDLFRKVADHVAGFDDLGSFNPQGLSNLVWAFATTKESHPELFEKVADHITGLGHLGSFNPQGLSNLVWAYATAKEPHPDLFKKVSNEVVKRDLGSFNRQNLSNLVWAYATAKASNPDLFEKVAGEVVKRDLRSFNAQDFSNIVWAYATAKEPHPDLFKKVVDRIISLDNLEAFKPQDLSMLAWACATAKNPQPQLFQKLAYAAIKSKHELNSQEIANLLWAYAANGHIDSCLFSSFIPTTKALLDQCNSQEFANIAWAYAVADVDAPSLFNDCFIHGCLEKRDEFNIENLTQLYQWHLWQDELKSSIRLPPSLEEKCYKAFVSEAPNPSALQNDVFSALASLGLNPEEEVLTPSGYSLDAVVEVNGKKIGIEVDGPFHFLDRQPTGSTILKHRQIANLEEMPLVSVPYWEWNKLGKDSKKEQQYLNSLLGLTNNE